MSLSVILLFPYFSQGEDRRCLTDCNNFIKYGRSVHHFATKPITSKVPGKVSKERMSLAAIILSSHSLFSILPTLSNTVAANFLFTCPYRKQLLVSSPVNSNNKRIYNN